MWHHGRMALFDVGGFFGSPRRKLLYTVRGEKYISALIKTHSRNSALLSSRMCMFITPHTKTQTETADETCSPLTASTHGNYAVKSCMSVHLCVFAQQTREKEGFVVVIYMSRLYQIQASSFGDDFSSHIRLFGVGSHGAKCK